MRGTLGMVAGLALSAGPVLACGCAKEAMLKLHGTVSMAPPDQQQGDLQQGSPQQAAPAINLLRPLSTGAPVQPGGQTQIPTLVVPLQ